MAKKKSSFFNMVSTLFLVTAVAAFALGAVYNATKEPIAKAKKEKLEKAIKEVVPVFDNDIANDKKAIMITEKDSVVFYYARKGDELVGTAVETYTKDGFSGKFRIMVGFLPDSSIFNTAVLEHKETPGLGDKMDVKKSKFPVQFKEKNPGAWTLKVKKDGGDVDAITAATISSRGFCDAVQRAYDNYIKVEGGKE